MNKRGINMVMGMIAFMAFLLIPAMNCFADSCGRSVPTPEPMSLLLLGMGIAGLVGVKKFFK